MELYHYKARAYSPALGRFMQTDPIGYEAGYNLYRYVLNDPINLIDPLGLNEVDKVVVTGKKRKPCPTGYVCVYGRSILQNPFVDIASNRPELTGKIDFDLVRERVCETRRSMQPQKNGGNVPVGSFTGAVVAWIAKVRPGGSWDDKRGGQGQLERQGNFSFGATAAALGFSKATALRGAGAVQRFGNVALSVAGKPLAPSQGSPTGGSPYGDDATDQPPIEEGYDFEATVKC